MVSSGDTETAAGPTDSLTTLISFIVLGDC